VRSKEGSARGCSKRTKSAPNNEGGSVEEGDPPETSALRPLNTKTETLWPSVFGDHPCPVNWKLRLIDRDANTPTQTPCSCFKYELTLYTPAFQVFSWQAIITNAKLELITLNCLFQISSLGLM